MLAEAIRVLFAKQQQAEQPIVTEIDGVDTKVWLSHNGALREVTIPTPRINGTVRSLTALCDSCLPSTAVYHQHTRIDAVLDLAERRDHVRMPLEESRQFETLGAWRAHTHKMDPKGAVHALRFELGLEPTHPLIAALRVVDFSRSGVGKHVVEHGKESLGRSVETAVQKADQFPTEVTVNVPIYSGLALKLLSAQGIVCGIELHPENEAISLCPLPDELETAIDRAQLAIGEHLKDKLEGPVYYGAP